MKPKNTIDFFEEDKMAHMIYKHFSFPCTDETIFEFSDLVRVTLRGDDVQGFVTKWVKFSYL